jgi:hypothetical protein
MPMRDVMTDRVSVEVLLTNLSGRHYRGAGDKGHVTFCVIPVPLPGQGGRTEVECR